jgi:hypothetical protein
MADVTLVLDNADACCRSISRCSSSAGGCIARRERVPPQQAAHPLRDLVDLLDAAHLADNAFLFIGRAWSTRRSRSARGARAAVRGVAASAP